MNPIKVNDIFFLKSTNYNSGVNANSFSKFTNGIH